MSDSVRLDRPLVGKLHRLWGTSVEPYSIGPANTNSVHPGYLQEMSVTNSKRFNQIQDAYQNSRIAQGIRLPVLGWCSCCFAGDATIRAVVTLWHV